MSSPSTDPLVSAAKTAPPPGCPAHGLGKDGIRRLYGPDAEGNPLALYAQLRQEHGAVARVLVPGDVEAWLVLGHSENLEVLRSPTRFSSDPVHFAHPVQADHPLAPLTFRQPLINFADGEEHMRLRRAVTESLARVSARGVRQHVTRAANSLIDKFATAGHADLVPDFAENLPMLVMTHLLGMADVSAAKIAKACRDLVQGTETAVASNAFLLETLRDLVDRKKQAPGHDVTSWLIEHESDLEHREVVEHLRQILVASNETTVNLIADALRVMLTHDSFRARLSGGSMTLPDALADVLWNNAPLRVLPARYAVGDTTLGGQEIRKGDMVLNGLAAGNVDPGIRPDLSVSMQGNRSHLSFSSGPHECPGQSIGLAIAEVAIDVLLGRLPDMQIAALEEELSRTPTWTSSHLDTLPVRFTPRSVERKAPAAPMPAAEPIATASGIPAESGTPSAPPAAVPAPAPTSWWRRLLGRR